MKGLKKIPNEVNVRWKVLTEVKSWLQSCHGRQSFTWRLIWHHTCYWHLTGFIYDLYYFFPYQYDWNVLPFIIKLEVNLCFYVGFRVLYTLDWIWFLFYFVYFLEYGWNKSRRNVVFIFSFKCFANFNIHIKYMKDIRWRRNIIDMLGTLTFWLHNTNGTYI